MVFPPRYSRSDYVASKLEATMWAYGVVEQYAYNDEVLEGVENHEPLNIIITVAETLSLSCPSEVLSKAALVLRERGL